MTVILTTYSNDESIQNDSIEKSKFVTIQNALDAMSEFVGALCFGNFPEANEESIKKFIADDEIDLKFTIEEII